MLKMSFFYNKYPFSNRFRHHFKPTLLGVWVGVVTLSLGGCATWSIERKSNQEWESGHVEASLAVLQEGVKQHPEDASLKSQYLLRKRAALETLRESIERAQQQHRWEEVEAYLKRGLDIEPQNPQFLAIQQRLTVWRRSSEAEQRILTLAKEQPLRALEEIVTVLQDDPRNATLLQLKRDLERRAQDQDEERKYSPTPIKVTLDFKDVPLKFIFEAITRSTGVLIQADKDIPATQRASITMKDARIEDAMNWLSKSAQLVIKPLNPKAWVVYPNTEEKRRQHEELIIKTFYPSHSDAKTLAANLKQLLNLKDVVIDERLNIIVLRENKETLRVVESLILQLDQVEAEVLLDMDIMEVNRSRLLQLGLAIPNQLTLSAIVPTTGQTLSGLKHLNRNQLTVSGLDSIGIDFKRELGDLDMLASPKLRVKHRGKASILIGDRVPSISSTFTGGASNFVTETINYIDVGLKLNIDSLSISPDHQVQLKLQLEVSNIASQIPTKSGSLAYQIGTRKAETELILRDGETQILAGLISHQERSSANRFPGLGDLPVVGRLFGTTRDDSQKTEIVLSITPRIIRNLVGTEGKETEIYSGTYNQIQSKPFTAVTEDAEKGALPSKNAGTENFGAVASTVSAEKNTAPNASTTQKPNNIALKWSTLETPLVLNKSFIVGLNLKSDGGLRGMPLQMQFDPKKIQIENIESGSFFDQGGGSTLFNYQVLNDGRVMVSLQRSQNDAVMGEAPILKIKLKALQSGSSTLTLLSASPMGLDQVPKATLAEPLMLLVP